MKILPIKEPKLLFGDNIPALDPCHGMSIYGPYGLKAFKSIKVGVIGSSDSILELENLILKMKNSIPHKRSLKWPFPGLGKESPLKIDIDIIRKKYISEDELKIFNKTDKENRKERIIYAISLIEEKIISISGPQPTPDIILISIPEILLNSCRSQKFKHTNYIYLLKRQFSKLGLKDFRDGYNFHNIIKVIGLQKHIPTQLIYPNTLIPNPKSKGRQDIAMIAWNLAAAFLYKANEIPWKYFEFPDDTCFIGISFHREYDDSDEQVVRASIAQTFLSDGKDIVLRGKRFNWDDTEIKSPHMTAEYAESLIEEILSHYSKIRNDPLKRVVIHKSSVFWDEETQGLNKALRDIPKIDLITISNTNLRFYRYGQETVVRGTFIEFFGKYYLYNMGFIPCLNIYPGSRIPAPLEIKFFQKNEDKITICKEIMALARLNWNNIDYSTREPVTLTFSRNVGKILSEYRARSIEEPPDQYKYYM